MTDANDAGSNQGTTVMRTFHSIRRGMLGVLLLTGTAFTPAQAMLQGPDLRLSERLALSPQQDVAAAPSAASLSLKFSDDIGNSLIREVVLVSGEALVGTDYVYGADSEDAVDCSSLVQRMYRSVGIEMPRTTREMIHLGSKVDTRDLVAGDLLFYRWGRSGLHVAVYLPGGRILHASSQQGEVVVSQLNSAWQRRMVGARRVI